MAGQPAPDPSGLGMLSASYGPTAAAQRSQDLAQALAAMRVPAEDVRAPVDPVGDRLAEALMQRRYGPSAQDPAETAQPVLPGPDWPSSGPSTAFLAPAPTPDPYWLPSGRAVTAPTSDDPMPASPWSALQYGEVNFHDLIPNQGASWRPSSSGAGVPLGQTVGEALSAGPVQESQTAQQAPDGGGGSTDAATPPLRWQAPGVHYFGADGENGADGVGNSRLTAPDSANSGSTGDANPPSGTNPATVREVVVTAHPHPTVIDDSPANFVEDLLFVLKHPALSLAYIKQSANDAAHNFVGRFEGSAHNVAEHVDKLPGHINKYAQGLSSYLNGVAHHPVAAVQAAPGLITGAASQLTSTLNATGPNIVNGVRSKINTYGAAWQRGGAHDVLVQAAGDVGAATPMAGMAAASFVLPELSELDVPAIGELGNAADALNPIARQFPTVARSATEESGGPIGPYGDLVGKLKGTSLQANHLNQNAAFGEVIPRDVGLSVGMRGNAFADVGSPHYEFHAGLEEFWKPYRIGGDLFGLTPTNAQYGSAMEDALVRAGYTPSQAANIAERAAAQRAAYGLSPSTPVPRVPGRLPQVPPRP